MFSIRKYPFSLVIVPVIKAVSFNEKRATFAYAMAFSEFVSIIFPVKLHCADEQTQSAEKTKIKRVDLVFIRQIKDGADCKSQLFIWFKGSCR